ncbi:MAG: hypothetical protein APR63_13445 [Desulfuromonas sp. SDB]|nr:MAG: hypothetical protein APR63_13445 [Desulfuromonas sp. SDB]
MNSNEKPTLKSIIKNIIRRGPKTSPQKKIAVVVTHGVGDQEPYQTLDLFTRHFYQIYQQLIKQEFPEVELKLSHQLIKFDHESKSTIRIFSEPQISRIPQIDIYEFYWADITEGKIEADEVISCIFDIAKGAKKFYSEIRHQGELNSKSGYRPGRNENKEYLFTYDGEFLYLKYLINLVNYACNFSRFSKYLIKMYRLFFPSGLFENFIYKMFIRGFNSKIVNVLGDLALYTASDRKSEFYGIRKKILKRSTEFITELISGKNDNEYNEIILLGHSLGSVIFYDTIDYINKLLNLNPEMEKNSSKLSGFITLGSPLDKVAFLFAQRINSDINFVRSAITSHLHSFKKHQPLDSRIETNLKTYFNDIEWLNFWSPSDPISGFLDVYKPLKNYKLVYNDPIISKHSHSFYWECEDIYKKIIEVFNLI